MWSWGRSGAIRWRMPAGRWRDWCAIPSRIFATRRAASEAVSICRSRDVVESSFLKKSSSKTFMSLSRPSPEAHSRTQKLFGSFFQKRTASFIFCESALRCPCRHRRTTRQRHRTPCPDRSSSSSKRIQQHRTRGTQRMAHGDRAAVDVHPLVRDIECRHHAQNDGGKSLVHLIEIHIRRRHSLRA